MGFGKTKFRFFTSDRAEGVKGTKVGFCGNCGYVRQDTDGVVDTDCLCIAETEHKLGCRYLGAISCKVGIACDEHGKDVCPECDACNCDEIEGDVVNPGSPRKRPQDDVGTKYIVAMKDAG